MKKFLTVALAGVLAASMLFTGCSKKAESKVPDKLIVGTNAEFPPFEYMNDKKQPEGFDIAMIKEIGKRMGKKVEIKNMEFKSLIGAMESDSINAIIAGMTKTEKREKAVDFSDSYYTTNQAIILKKDSKIAIDLGMSQTLVGLTIVSIGTSLPELVTSVVAARKNEVDMAVGNAVGSNIFNILMVLGIASAISPVSLISENVIDILVLVGFSVVVWFFARSDRKITRNEGIAMVAMYLIYTAYIIMR